VAGIGEGGKAVVVVGVAEMEAVERDAPAAAAVSADGAALGFGVVTGDGLRGGFGFGFGVAVVASVELAGEVDIVVSFQQSVQRSAFSVQKTGFDARTRRSAGNKKASRHSRGFFWT